MAKITGFATHDVRFPTSLRLDGSDAMNPSPDYSAAYLNIETDETDPAVVGGAPLAGHSFVFTIGPGNDVQLADRIVVMGNFRLLGEIKNTGDYTSISKAIMERITGAPSATPTS